MLGLCPTIVKLRRERHDGRTRTLTDLYDAWLRDCLKANGLDMPGGRNSKPLTFGSTDNPAQQKGPSELPSTSPETQRVPGAKAVVRV